MSYRNLANSVCRVYNCMLRDYDNEAIHRRWIDFPGPIKALETLNLVDADSIGTYETAMKILEKYHNVELVHITEIKREQAKQKAKKRKKANAKYARSKFAPVPAQGEPMQRLKMSVSEITKKRKPSNTWKKAAEHLQHVSEQKQLRAANSAKTDSDREKRGETPGMFPESTKVTKAHAAQKRASLQAEMVPSTNNSEYKRYKQGENSKTRGAGVGAQTRMF